MEELIIRINNLLELTGGREQQVQNGNIISFGSFSFHLGKHELKNDDKTQKLSHREAQLLRILFDHRNKALDRKTILKEVWGDDSFLTPGTWMFTLLNCEVI